jgi:hypothetical protein
MYFLNLSLGQFLAVFGGVSAVMIALYLLDRSRRRQVVSTLRFWNMAEQPPVVTRRKRIQQPLSLILQLISMALLLLAIAQLRFGAPAAAPRDHVLLLETSAWMGARAGRDGRTLMDVARERALAYVKAVPARDRVMLVRVDALATPATSFEPDRRKLERAIYESQPGATALNLEQAFTFASQVQAQGGRHGGEIALVGSGRVAETDDSDAKREAPKNLRYIQVADNPENCGLRKIGLRRSTAEPDLWEIYVSARNYGTTPRAVTLALGFGPSGKQAAVPVGSQHLVLPPGAEREAEFPFRTRAAGVLEARILPHDGFPDDDRAVLELPSQELLRVTVYSDQPNLLRPALAANPRVNAVFRSPAEYKPEPQTKGAELVILDRFRPPSRPQVDSIWIDPPAQGSPIAVRARKTDVPFERWIPDHPLGAGLRTKDFRLESTSVLEASPADIRIGEVADGPVIVAREGKPKVVVMGFHPGLSGMRYELATPLLFANILGWMSPQVFRRWELSAGSVGTVKMPLDRDMKPSELKVQTEDGKAVPFTLRGQALQFFAGNPGTVRVMARDREYVYSLTLPQMWAARWEPPSGTRHGIPRARVLGGDYTELWRWLAILGAAGLIAEWILYGRLKRGLVRVASRNARPRAADAPPAVYTPAHEGQEVPRS